MKAANQLRLSFKIDGNELGISQAALAEQTGMGIATIKRF